VLDLPFQYSGVSPSWDSTELPQQEGGPTPTEILVWSLPESVYCSGTHVLVQSTADRTAQQADEPFQKQKFEQSIFDVCIILYPSAFKK
jgi:hypothetical protein